MLPTSEFMRKLGVAAIIGASLLASACATPPATGQAAIAAMPAAEKAKFEADRKAILAMAGDYYVTFDFRETVSLTPGYELKKPKVSGADEIVRLVEDRGDHLAAVAGPHTPADAKQHARGVAGLRHLRKALDAVPAVGRGEDLDVELRGHFEKQRPDLLLDAVVQAILEFVDQEEPAPRRENLQSELEYTQHPVSEATQRDRPL